MTAAAWRERLAEAWAGLRARYPWLRWLERWGVSLGSLILGVGTLFVFRRGLEYFPLFVGYLLLVWLAAVVFAEARQALASRGRRVISLVLDYTIQTLLHGLLLFLLPIYYASTTLTSGNVWFLFLLTAAALLTTVDPWFRAVTRRFRGVELVLFWVGLFASLDVAFPLVGIRSGWALTLSGAVSMLALTPVFRRRPGITWRRALLWAAVLGMGAAGALWSARSWIPPVPLQLTRATFARSVSLLEPQDPVVRVSAEEVRSWGGLAAFTAVAAPAGLREPIYHVWRKDGIVVARVLLSAIRGGRPGGFRTYSRKGDLGQDPVGTWSVDVQTAAGQLIGRLRLRVTP